MSKVEDYRLKLRSLKDWIPYLRKESGLPGPRGNLELAAAVAAEGDRAIFEQLLATPPGQSGENTPGVFLIFCGIMGLGKLAAQGDHKQFARLRTYAGDGRWRVREGVATGLQLVGDADAAVLVREMTAWSHGSWLEQRAAAAALAEPRLLKDAEIAKATLGILNLITSSIATAEDRGGDAFRALRQAMGYCWSVVVAARPPEGRKMLEKWLKSKDKDVRWFMRENLKKNRLMRADPAWTTARLAELK